MLWALIIILGFAMDRLSKVWVLDKIAGNPVTVIKDFFYLRHLENDGAAFSILQGKTVFLILMVSVVSLAMLYYLIKEKNKFLRLSLSLILGGALGNLYDRIFSNGKVVDFLEFHFGSYVFPTFNVADILVVVGTILLAIYILFLYKEEKPEPVQQEQVKDEAK
ncbi:signal peptidase II [Ruminiclostridium cellulolyticum]|uniref:Lipoprotein signal peptidase n=1 Tax=Ruminiclostridium cellulolyticum (strain ATCC 35319 / DSM 5812 / JCM 6584 / H10) TaxID=394503 RepID=B8I766_RUMCH|nr:signal peptidase II [Ruminiclostridium cellulolyticum]ACL74990.1 lipoprotein signal peptidase [Ruminiclostridium cellulolyticum H10]